MSPEDGFTRRELALPDRGLFMNPMSPAESVFTEEMNALSPAAQIQGFNAPVSPQSPSSSIVDGLGDMRMNSPDPLQMQTTNQLSQSAVDRGAPSSSSSDRFVTFIRMHS